MNFKNVFFEIEDFQLTDQCVGEGTFGKVYIAEKVNEPQSDGEATPKFAAKIIKFDKDIGLSGKEQMKLMREATILHQLKHPSIVKFIGINFQKFDDPTQLEPTIITEYLPNGSLKSLLHNKKKRPDSFTLTPTHKYIWLLGISNALKYLHQQGILHRDLKSDNVLLDNNYYPRICDFGISRCFSNLHSNTLTGAIGTPLYMAPELFGEDTTYTEKVDVFAFGILAYEILTETIPYHELPKKKLHPVTLGIAIMNGTRPKFPDNFPSTMKNLIEQCWSQDAEGRPTFDTIYNKLSKDLSLLGDELDQSKINEYIQTVINSESIVSRNQLQNMNDPLYLAVTTGNFPAIQRLLSNGMVDVNKRFIIDNSEKTALHIAIENNDVPIVELLLKQPTVDVNANSITRCPVIKIEGDEEEYDEDEDRPSRHYPYLTEINEEKYNTFKKFKVPPRHIDKYRKWIEVKTPLSIAVENGYVGIVSLLMRHDNINPNIKTRFVKTTQYLTRISSTYLSFLCKQNIEEKTPLHLAIEKQDKGIIQLLINEKTDMNIKTRSSKSEYYRGCPAGRIPKGYHVNDYNIMFQTNCGKFRYEEFSALHLSIDKNNVDIFLLLLNSENIDVNIKSKSEIDYTNVSDFCRDIREMTPLHHAIDKDNSNFVALLLKHREIDVNISVFVQDPWHKGRITALCKAIENENLDIINCLLNSPYIDVNHFSTINKNYYTKPNYPIFAAVETGRADIVQALLQHSDIQTNLVDHKNRTPADLTNNPKIKALFSKYP